MKRNKHGLSHYRLLTTNMGWLTPVACFEVLPGDTIQQSTSVLARVSPLVAPVMHPVTVRVHHWFVPYRLLWDEWEAFITGGSDGLGDGAVFPTVQVSNVPQGSLGDYLGIPTGRPNLEVSWLPGLAYGKIWNEFYRDQDLQAELFPAGGVNLLGPPASIAWEKDYFTSARPWPQKGPDVSMPLGVEAPVIATGDGIPYMNAAGQVAPFASNAGGGNVIWGGVASAGATQNASWVDTKLVADLTQASAVNVNDVRRAFALQRYQEARARYGSRYVEYLRYLGIKPSDARLQRPEYLGGAKQTISFSEVLQTAPGSTLGSPTPGGVGQMAGHGIAAMRSRRYRRFFEEHGVVLSLMSVRPKTIYQDGLARMWSRRVKEDFYQRELEQIGQQQVYRREVYAEADNAGNGGDAIFGYQDRYSEYKHEQSTVHGYFRQTLNYWHMARQFASAPALNDSFVRCDPTRRIYQY